MRKYKIAWSDGTIKEIEGNKITIYIKNLGHEFIIHESFTYSCAYELSHKASGLHITSLLEYMPAARGDTREAAKLAISNLVKTKGADYILQVLNNAPRLEN
jgi:hypothetical protein